LNSGGQGTEIGHTLQFVVRKFDFEVLLQPGEQIECLQAVDSQRLKEILVGAKLGSRHLEVSGGQAQYLV